MKEYESRLEQIDREIRRFKARNPQLEVLKHAVELISQELEVIWSLLESQSITKDHRGPVHKEPASDEVEIPKNPEPVQIKQPVTPLVAKPKTPDPRESEMERDAGSDLDAMIESLNKKEEPNAD